MIKKNIELRATYLLQMEIFILGRDYELYYNVLIWSFKLRIPEPLAFNFVIIVIYKFYTFPIKQFNYG